MRGRDKLNAQMYHYSVQDDHIKNKHQTYCERIAIDKVARVLVRGRERQPDWTTGGCYSVVEHPLAVLGLAWRAQVDEETFAYLSCTRRVQKIGYENKNGWLSRENKEKQGN